MATFYELLNQRNKLQKRITQLKNQFSQERKSLNKRITRLENKIELIQQQNHYYEKYKTLLEENDDLKHEKWLLKYMLEQFRHLVISNETLETLKKKAEDKHLEKFGEFKLKWRNLI